MAIVLLIAVYLLVTYYLFHVPNPPPEAITNTVSIPSNQPVVNTPDLLLVQVQIYRRKPVPNTGFTPFLIDKESYTFNGQSYPRPCFAIGECAWSDYRAMLRILLTTPWSYLYMIEDDTYFCGDLDKLHEIMSYNLPIVATGIGGSGNLISREALATVIGSPHKANGFDLLISYHFPHLCYRYYMELNIHLYEGSLYGHGHGAPVSLYPTCFEIACGNYQPSGVGNMNWYNLALCRGIIEKSSDTKGCLAAMAQVNGTRQVPVCGKYCRTKCQGVEGYVMLQ